MMQYFLPEAVYVEDRVFPLANTQEILSRLPGIPVEKIPHLSEVLAREKGSEKKILILSKQEGKFLKPCPGTKNHLCCGYYFINLATNCNVGCSYCILQGYLNNPFMTVCTNLEDLFTELDQIRSAFPGRHWRIGTGELTDSLVLDHLTFHSKKLIAYFASWPEAVLELKTKTTQIQNLMEISGPPDNVIISWSLNPPRIIREEEKNAPLLQERLEAAKQCLKAGYRLGFHFDPLLHYPEWEREYRETIDALFEVIPAEKIVWISLGALRYPVEMDRIIRKNHPESPIVLGEFFPGKDGKLRYFRPIREKMFETLIDAIRGKNKKVTVYLCMESPQIWDKVFHRPASTLPVSLPALLDQAAQQR
jgi:spore photoproduct lyase